MTDVAVTTAGARSRSIIEVCVALIGVSAITISSVALRPTVVATKSPALIIPFELGLYVVLVGFVAALNTLNGRRLGDGLAFRWRPTGRQLTVAVALFVFTISFIVVPLLLGADRTDLLSFKARNAWVLLYSIVHSLLFVGFGEELVWRGYFTERMKEITGSLTWSVIVPGLLFGLWHYPGGQNVMQVGVTAVLGCLYGWVRLKVRGASTLTTGLAHGLHDTAIVVLSYFLLSA